MPKINEEPESMAGRPKIVVNLRSVFIHQRRDRLDLHDDFSEANEIRRISLLQRPPFVVQREALMGEKGSALASKLQLQTLLKHRLEKSAAFLLIDLKARAHDAIRLLAIDDLVHVFLSCVSC